MKTHYLVAGISAVAVAVFVVGNYFYSPQQPANVTLASDSTATADNTSQSASTNDSALIRAYSPILGPENAPVTIVEFLTPAVKLAVRFIQ